MRYVNWGVVSRHSHAPILISLLLSNDLLHLFYRGFYLQNATILRFSLPCLLHLLCFIHSSALRQLISVTCTKVSCRTRAWWGIIRVSYFICESTLNILLGSSNIFLQMLNLKNKLYYRVSHIQTIELAKHLY